MRVTCHASHYSKTDTSVEYLISTPVFMNHPGAGKGNISKLGVPRNTSEYQSLLNNTLLSDWRDEAKEVLVLRKCIIHL